MILAMQKALKWSNRYIRECPLRGSHQATKNDSFSETLNLSMLSALILTTQAKSANFTELIYLHMLKPINASTDDLRQFGIYKSITPLLLKLAMPTVGYQTAVEACLQAGWQNLEEEEEPWLISMGSLPGFSSIHLSSKQCSGSMTFWCGSGSADLCLWIMDPDPDPAIFVIDLQDANKKLI
jgi:hypothetical protein